jgi:hypothetical protein
LVLLQLLIAEFSNLYMAENDVEAGAGWAVVETCFVIIRVGVCRWAITVHQSNVIGINDSTSTAFIRPDWWSRAAEVGSRIYFFVKSKSEWRWVVPSLAWRQAHDGTTISVHLQVSDVTFITWAGFKMQVTVSSTASALLDAWDDFDGQGVSIDQTDVIPDITPVVAWREEELDLGLCRWIASSWEAGIDGLTDFAVLSISIAALFRPEATSPAVVGDLVGVDSVVSFQTTNAIGMHRALSVGQGRDPNGMRTSVGEADVTGFGKRESNQ